MLKTILRWDAKSMPSLYFEACSHCREGMYHSYPDAFVSYFPKCTHTTAPPKLKFTACWYAPTQESCEWQRDNNPFLDTFERERKKEHDRSRMITLFPTSPLSLLKCLWVQDEIGVRNQNSKQSEPVVFPCLSASRRAPTLRQLSYSSHWQWVNNKHPDWCFTYIVARMSSR